MGYKGQSGVRNHAELICFFPPSPSGWGTWSCPVWLNATIPLSLSRVKLAQACGQDDRMQAPLFATSRLGRVTMATARLLEIHGGYAGVEDRSPPQPRERGWWLYWKLADRGCREERPGAATSHVRTGSELWPSRFTSVNWCTFFMEGLFDTSSHLTTKGFL